MTVKRVLTAACLIGVLVFGYLMLNYVHASSSHAATSILPIPKLALHVQGNQLMNAQGQVVRLIGVDRFGECMKGVIMHGPTDQSSVDQLTRWHINVVRIIMNEDCWLGINGAPGAGLTAQALHSAIVAYVHLLNLNGMYVIFDLHTNAPGTLTSVAQQVMADEDHAPAYWKSVADTFKNNPAVILEPYNEPHITKADAQTTDPWTCWLNGCEVTVYNTAYGGPTYSLKWQGAGMQQLVHVIRATGATNVITLGGLAFSNDLSQLVAHLPSDPDHQLTATFHSYKGWGCGTQTCWNTTIAPVAQHIPVLTDEMGQKDCQHDYVDSYMKWADAHGISYLAWVWVIGGCGTSSTSGLFAGNWGLLSDWNGDLNSYGLPIVQHFKQEAP